MQQAISERERERKRERDRGKHTGGERSNKRVINRVWVNSNAIARVCAPLLPPPPPLMLTTAETPKHVHKKPSVDQ